MLKIIGEYTSAIIYSDAADEYVKAQVKMICDNPVSKGSKVRVMPDIHTGKAGPAGLSMTIGDAIMPMLAGADIGCGISYIRTGNEKIEYMKLDRVIRECIPSGGKIRAALHRYSRDFSFDGMACRKYVNEERALLSLGTLGSGNHFIEADKDDEGNQYIFVHSGSRHLGVEVTEYYLKEGQKQLKKRGTDIPYELTYLEGSLMEDYLNDLNEVMGFAMLNREIILTEIAERMKLEVVGFGESVHNCVDENRILRNGAARAYMGDEVIIPVNMRDGIILGRGRGNPEWNCSAPHGIGRIMNRSEGGSNHTVSELKKEGEILDVIKDTVKVEKILKPAYNCRAAETGQGRCI